MEKAFDFVRNLKAPFIELLGFPEIKIFSDYVEVYFTSCSVIRDLEVFEVSCDEFRMFASDGNIIVVFTFYKS